MRNWSVALFAFVALCCQDKKNVDPSFELTLTISNPARQFKVRFVVSPEADNLSRGRIRVPSTASGIPYYREAGVVRRNLLDTVSIPQNRYDDLMALLYTKNMWHRSDMIGDRTDGTRFEFEIRETGRYNQFVIMGNASQDGNELAEAVEEIFDLCFDSVGVAGDDSFVQMRKVSRLSGLGDSSEINIRKRGLDVTFEKRSFTKSLDWNSYCELWQKLESHHVWELKDNTDYARRYPVEYTIFIERGQKQLTFKVFAPTHIGDKRYFRVINAIESIQPEI